MNGLFLNSTSLSLASSSEPRSIVSDPTTSSSDGTAEGIGSLGGRALYAFGEAALRGFENLAIRRKLRSIKSLFPHDDTDTTKGVERIYDDVLELSRSGLYRPEVRKQVLKLLLVQIGIRQTHHLIRRLVKWPTVELALFLAELMVCMPHDWLPPGTDLKDMHRELVTTYLSCQTVTGSRSEYHPASPIIDFLLAFAQIDTATCQAVLDAGFLDMLLCMYICNFNCSIMPYATACVHGKSMMMEACTDALLQLCEQPGALTAIFKHPLHALWPQSRPLSLRFKSQTKNRPLAWRQLGPVVVARRLATLPCILELPVPDGDSLAPYLVEACIDLVEFSRHLTYGYDIAEDALRCIRRCVELREFHRTALNKALSDVHPAYSADVCRRLMLRGSSMNLLLEKLPFSRRATFPIGLISTARTLDHHHGRSKSLPTPQSENISHSVLAADHNAKASHQDDPWTRIVDEGCSSVFSIAWSKRNSRWSTDRHDYETHEPCLDGTREVVLQRMKHSIENVQADSDRIFWLQGAAGEGKSAIVSSISRWFNDTKRYLGASFVFSRDDSHRSDTRFLISTIAIQLAMHHYTLNQYVCRAMDQCGYQGRSLACDEFNLLLKKPLEAAARQSPFTIPIVIVLDGIDELWSEESFRKDIFATIVLLDQLPTFVKILITGRPRHDLQTLFDSMSSRVKTWRLGNVPMAVVDNDIAKFIAFRMVALVNKHDALHSAEWPGWQKIMALADKCRGNFGWASRAIDFIGCADGDPEQRLDETLNGHHSLLTDALDSLSMDTIYKETLEEAYPDPCSSVDLLLFHDVVGAISTVRRTISLHALCTLLGFIEDQSAHVVSKLPTIMTIIRSDKGMASKRRMIDPSFSAYLTSVRCPPRFFIDSKTHHTALAMGCLLRMRECLKRNICEVEDPLSLNNAVKGLEMKTLQHLPDDLRYACQFFAEHVLESCQCWWRLYELLETFFCKDVRNWLEASSLLGFLDRAAE